MLAHVEPLDKVVLLCKAIGEGEVQIAAPEHVGVDRLRPDQLNWSESQIDSTRFIYFQWRDLCDNFTVAHSLVLNIDLEGLLQEAQSGILDREVPLSSLAAEVKVDIRTNGVD